MKFVAIVEARTGSKRLPNKVMKKLNDKEVIIYLLDRLKQSKNLDDILVATTSKKKDDKLVKLLKKNKIKFFRGPENNVLKRVYLAAKQNKADVIVEVSGDSPLVDPFLIDEAIIFFKTNNKLDYLNVDHGYPGGIGFEVFRINSLKESFIKAKKNYEKEHVTPYIINNPKRFNSFYFIADKENSSSTINFLLDEEKDYIFLRDIVSNLKKKNYRTSQLLKLIKQKKIELTNKEVKRNSVYYK
jgi:spore coat polysaccharide biosynthesis protein SpsF